MVRDDDGAHAGTLACAGHCTKVAHVGNTVKHNDKRILALVEQVRHQVLGTIIGHGSHHRKYALMVAAGDAVNLLNRDTLHGHAQCTGLLDDFSGCFVIERFAQQDFVDVFAGIKGLEHGMNAVDVLGLVNHLSLCLCFISDFAFSIAAWFNSLPLNMRATSVICSC